MQKRSSKKKIIIGMSLLIIFILIIGGMVYWKEKNFFHSKEQPNQPLLRLSFDYENAPDVQYEISLQSKTIYKVVKSEKIPITTQTAYDQPSLLAQLRMKTPIGSHEKKPGVIVYDYYEDDTYFLGFNDPWMQKVVAYIKDEVLIKEQEKYQNTTILASDYSPKEKHAPKRNQISTLEYKDATTTWKYIFYEDNTVLNAFTNEPISTGNMSLSDIENQMMKNPCEPSENYMVLTKENHSYYQDLKSEVAKEILDQLSPMIIEENQYNLTQNTKTGKYQLSKEKTSTEENRWITTYPCRSDSCQIKTSSNNIPQFIIYEDAYYVIHLEENTWQKEKIEIENITNVRSIMNEIYEVKTPNETLAYHVKKKKVIAKDYQDFLKLSDEKRLFAFQYQNRFDIYQYENEKLLGTIPINPDRITYLNAYTTPNKIYYQLHQNDLRDQEFFQIYNQNLQPILNGFYLRGFDEQEQVIVTTSSDTKPGLAGYTDVHRFYVFDDNQNQIKESKNYKSILSPLNFRNTKDATFFAIDDTNHLKWYDQDETELLTLDEWNENMALKITEEFTKSVQSQYHIFQNETPNESLYVIGIEDVTNHATCYLIDKTTHTILKREETDSLPIGQI